MLAQPCLKPFGIKLSERTQSSIQVQWNDNNALNTAYDIELVSYGEIRKGVATHYTSDKNIILNGLNNSTSYEFYIRSKCSGGSTSDWNGPFSFYTLLANPTPCMTALPLKDNGTETYTTLIEDTGILGKTKTLESVKIIVQHGWPADIKLTLEAPSGKQVVLSKHHGTLYDDYGNIKDTNCLEVTSFSPFACAKIKDSQPPFVGDFLPDDNMFDLLYNENINGIWKLIVYDRAINDRGVLKYLFLEFSDNTCQQPENVALSEIKTNSALLTWTPFTNCKSLTLEIADPQGHVIVKKISCQEQHYSITGLSPNTYYSLTVHTECENKIVREESCPVFFTTLCEPVTIQETFDNLPLCNAGCSQTCQMNGNIFLNAIEDGNQDWIVWEGSSPNENTGPDQGADGNGKYAYVDNNGLVCGPQNTVLLVSKCLHIKSNQSECDFSFYYHMFGVDIGSLFVDISLDFGKSWETLMTLNSGNKDKWFRQTLSLKAFDGKYAVIRFFAVTSPGVAGDIAIDQIEFYGTTLVEEGRMFFVDNDRDNYGNDTTSVYFCSSVAPIGFSIMGGDCNDDNPSIHPLSPELECNGIDENCNGFGDEQPPVNFISYTTTVADALCSASSNGRISINVNGGNPPYEIIWNQGEKGAEIQNLKQGFYNATITDFGGCSVVTDFIHVSTTSELQAAVTSIDKASCLGKSDGNIFIAHNDALPPYAYKWSNGATTKNLLDIGQGSYAVTISDKLGCATAIKNINVTSNTKISGVFKNIKESLCYGQNKGVIDFEAFNGSPPYNYKWNNGQTTPKITDLAAGLYTITVSDDNDCVLIQSIAIAQPDSLYSSIVDIVPNKCFGDANGQITTKPSGGTPPYYYLWNTGHQTDDIYGLTSGTFRLTLTDDNGCIAMPITVQLSDPEPLSAAIDSTLASSCSLSHDGYLSIEINGGVQPYHIVWNHIKNDTSILSNIPAGVYGFTGFDANSCKFSLENIIVPSSNKAIPIDVTVDEKNGCANDSLNSIFVKVNSEFGPFDYNWSIGSQYFNTSNLDTLTQLTGGLYSLTITDSIGCVGVSPTVHFPILNPISYTVVNLMQNTCPQDSTGSITLGIQSDNPIASVVWNSNNAWQSATISNLPVGYYTAEIIDAKGCRIATEAIQVNATIDIVIDSVIIDDSDNSSNGSICVDILSGNTPYFYHWSTDIDAECITNLKAGLYHLTITDGLGCEFYFNFVVESTSSVDDQITKIAVYPTVTQDWIFFRCDPALILDVEVYNYLGAEVLYQNSIGNNGSMHLNNLPAGQYFIKIVDNYNRINWFRCIKIY